MCSVHSNYLVPAILFPSLDCIVLSWSKKKAKVSGATAIRTPVFWNHCLKTAQGIQLVVRVQRENAVERSHQSPDRVIASRRLVTAAECLKFSGIIVKRQVTYRHTTGDVLTTAPQDQSMDLKVENVFGGHAPCSKQRSCLVQPSAFT
ncbi:hypothetical protein AC579_1728 [Pseudocercospora musae]|uniref:Uncharacterized protein n=1 Tax=Pseudocercospora musae TaxID=113226 RepID=A0A139IES1_9PEZI|nr:hypothetical protein AC579_1728 [Pseudocercospora musae]